MIVFVLAGSLPKPCHLQKPLPQRRVVSVHEDALSMTEGVRTVASVHGEPEGSRFHGLFVLLFLRAKGNLTEVTCASAGLWSGSADLPTGSI